MQQELAAVHYQRAIIVVLVALAVAIAPLGAALAGPHLAATQAEGRAPVMHAPGAATSTDPVGHAEMADCEKMMGASGKSDCPCGGTDKSCSPEYCAAKCFKIFGALPLERLLHGRIAGHRRSAGQLQPTDWSRAPPPPPPRT